MLCKHTAITNKKRITEQYPTADVSAVGYCFYTELPYAPILSLEIKIIDKYTVSALIDKRYCAWYNITIRRCVYG